MLNKDHDFCLGLLVGASLVSKKPLPYDLCKASDVMPSMYRPLIELIDEGRVNMQQVSNACWHAKIDYLKGHTILECVARQLTIKYMEDLRVRMIKMAGYRLCCEEDRKALLDRAEEADLLKQVVQALSSSSSEANAEGK